MLSLLTKNYPSLRRLLIVDADYDWRRRQTLQQDRTMLPGRTDPYEVPNRCVRVSTTIYDPCGVRRRFERILHTRSHSPQCRPRDDRHRTQFVSRYILLENFEIIWWLQTMTLYRDLDLGPLIFSTKCFPVREEKGLGQTRCIQGRKWAFPYPCGEFTNMYIIKQGLPSWIGEY